jgi:NAD(P)-dependent dehydrogenase (short-subunit alcohol dehydrogenase family)
MRRELRGRVVLLTGGSRGIGRRLAERLVKRGAKLALAARSADELGRAAEALKAAGGDVLAVPADVTSAADRVRLVETAVAHFGGLDVLVNNAGIGAFGDFSSSSEEVLRRELEVNFFAPAEMMRLCVPHLAGGRQPAIVNVASLCGRRGLPDWTEHCASKHALCGLTEALRAEFARFDVSVLLIVPGTIRSDDLGRHLIRKTGRLRIDFAGATPPDRVARAIERALRTNRAESWVGSDTFWVARGQRWTPWLLDWVLRRRYLRDSRVRGTHHG